MQFVKILFIFACTLMLYSFVFQSNTEESKEELYQSFLNKFESVPLPNELILKPHGIIEEERLVPNPSDTNRLITLRYNDFIPEIGKSIDNRMGISVFEAEFLLTGHKMNYNALVYSRSYVHQYNKKLYYLAFYDKYGVRLNLIKLGGLEEEKEQILLKASSNIQLVAREFSVENNDAAKKLVERKTTTFSANSKGEIFIKNAPKPVPAKIS